MIYKRPLLENNCFKNAPSLDLTSFIPKTADTIDPDFNCVCVALGTISIRNPNQGVKFEERIRFLRKEGPDRHLLKLMGAAPLINGSYDYNFVSITDLRMLARTFRIIFTCFVQPMSSSKPTGIVILDTKLAQIEEEFI